MNLALHLFFSEATQLILNHYTMYRSDHPNKSHEAASSETARILGVTLTAVRRALRECASYTDLETSRIKSAGVNINASVFLVYSKS